MEAKRTAYRALRSPWPGDRLYRFSCGQSRIDLRWRAESMLFNLLLPVDFLKLFLARFPAH